MTQSPPDWVKIAGAVSTAIGLIAGYTAYMFRQRIEQKDGEIRQKDIHINTLGTRIEHLSSELNECKQERDREIGQVKEHHATAIEACERKIKDLEQSLEKSEERNKEMTEYLEELLSEINQDALSPQDLIRFRKIVSMLAEFKDTDFQEKSANLRKARKWLEHRRDLWVKEASQHILQKDQTSLSHNLEHFQRDLRGYLNWVISCMEVGHTQNYPLKKVVASPVFSSPYPYVDAINCIQRKNDWGRLNSEQVTCLSEFLEDLIERLNDELSF